MHIVLLGPDLFAAFHDFAQAAKELGVRVSGIGSTPQSRLRAGLKRHLDAWEQVRNPFDPREVAQAVRRLGRAAAVDRLETVEERLIESAAAAREELGVARALAAFGAPLPRQAGDEAGAARGRRSPAPNRQRSPLSATLRAVRGAQRISR